VPLTESNEILRTGKTLKNIRHVFFYTCPNSFLRVKTILDNVIWGWQTSKRRNISSNMIFL